MLAGTGPTAAYLTGTGHIYVGVVGTNRQMYLKVANLSAGFFSIGGQTTASPALTAISPSTLVAFSRGTTAPATTTGSPKPEAGPAGSPWAAG